MSNNDDMNDYADACRRIDGRPAQPVKGDGSLYVIARLRAGLTVDPERPYDLPEPAAWEGLRERYPGLIIRSRFEGRTRALVADFEERARALDPAFDQPSLLEFVEVVLPRCPLRSEGEIDRLLEELRSNPLVADAQLASLPGRPPQVVLTNAPMEPQQYYLSTAPVGIDAEKGWDVPWKTDSQLAIAEISWGWWDEGQHPDLPPRIHVQGDEVGEWSHGTSVAGILVAKKDGVGVSGILPSMAYRTVSSWSGTPVHWRPEVAIVDACTALKLGDVLLIEEQLASPLRPLEYDPLSRIAITTATSGGIVVVEPAGNGALRLDDWPSGGAFFLAPGTLEDSGAIMVGASMGPPPQLALSGTNYGTRVDCFAQGIAVATTDLPPFYYTTEFAGTSAAAAIVAGAAMTVQGAVESRGGTLLTSQQMRWVLWEYGTSPHPSADIGRMPNLGALLANAPLTNMPPLPPYPFP